MYGLDRKLETLTGVDDAERIYNDVGYLLMMIPIDLKKNVSAGLLMLCSPCILSGSSPFHPLELFIRPGDCFSRQMLAFF